MFTKEELMKMYKRRISANTIEYRKIKELTSFLPASAFIKQRLWHLINETTKNPGCKICGKPVKWNDTVKEQAYRTYCSHKCQHNDPAMRELKNKIEQEKYGSKREHSVEKMKKTCLERYGVEFAIQNEECKQKQKQTVYERYGVENVIQNEETRQRRVKTNIKKFGVAAPSTTHEIKEKVKKGIIERYGSIEQRYKLSQQKFKETMLAKYNVKHHFQRHIDPLNIEKLEDEHWLEQQHVDLKRTQINIAAELGVKYTTITRYLKKYDIPIQYNVHVSSQHEQELYDFLILNIPANDVIRNTRDIIPPQELDFYIPKHKLAIEYNGLYWHSELNGKNRYYHRNKLALCEASGIRLVHIFESEWMNDAEIVKSRLLNIMGRSERIYARNTDIKQISSEEARLFLNTSHIQGYHPSSINIGLFYNDELVALMTFGKSRYNKKYQYELIRYSNKPHTSVVGGAGKLLKYFIMTYKPDSMISYSDKRWNTGNLYERLGFSFSHVSEPNYWYFKPGFLQIYSRVNFQKHKLPKLLKEFDPTQTEWENIINNGYDRIWDCGNDVWIMKFT